MEIVFEEEVESVYPSQVIEATYEELPMKPRRTGQRNHLISGGLRVGLILMASQPTPPNVPPPPPEIRPY